MLYLGQTHAVAVPLPVSEKGLTIDVIRAAFDASYKRTYGRLLENIPVRVLNLRLSVIGKRPEVDIASLARGERAASAEDCHLADQQFSLAVSGMTGPSLTGCVFLPVPWWTGPVCWSNRCHHLCRSGSFGPC